MYKRYIFCCLFLIASHWLKAQELQAKVTVLAQRVNSTVDKNVFTTLQTQLTNLLNNRKWTSDVYQPNEKIQCNFLLNIESAVGDNVYKASLTVQAARPIFNAAYQSALINFQDADLTFKYVQYQSVDFNENQVQGTDALAANLSATFAYYVYTILGLDYDSYARKGGAAYFTKAQNIVTNAPESREISGWKSFDGSRNRYWLAENIMNTRFNVMHDVFYGYYRSALDSMYTDEGIARANALGVLTKLQTVNQDNPSSMIVQFFIQNRWQEFVGIFKKADPLVKSRALEILSQVDISNSNNYKTQLR